MGDVGTTDGRDGRKKETMEEETGDRNLHVHGAHPLLYEARHTC